MEALQNGEITFCENPITSDKNWEALGPFNDPNTTSQYHGRGMAIAVSPLDRDVILAGTNGIFKTTNGGADWEVTTDDEGFSNFGVHQIVWHPTDPDIVFAGTGINKMELYNNYGIGLIYSEDAGETWQQSTLEFDPEINGEKDRRIIIDIDIDPRSTTDRTIAYVLTLNKQKVELFMLDGALTNNWTLIKEYNRDWSLQLETIYSNLDINPANPNEFWFHSTGGIVKGTKNFSNSLSLPTFVSIPYPVNTIFCGISTINTVQISIPNNGMPMIHVESNNSNCGNRVYAWSSINMQWEEKIDLGVNPPPGVAQNPLNAAENFVVNKLNPDIFYVSNLIFMFKVDLNNTPQVIKMPVGCTHVDKRDIQLYESSIDGATDILYEANDGGFGFTENGFNWDCLETNGMTFTCYYGMDVAEFDQEFIVAGAQDDNLNEYNNGLWRRINPGGDNFECIIDPRDNGIVHQQSNYRYVKTNRYTSPPTYVPGFPECFTSLYTCNARTFKGFAFDLDPSNPERLIAGWEYMYISNDAGDSFTPIVEDVLPSQINLTKISSIKICPSNPDVIYYAREGYNLWVNNGVQQYDGGIYKLHELPGGNFYHYDITNNLRTIPRDQNTDDPLYGRFISDIAVDPLNENRIWVSLSGYSSNQRVFYSDNGGQNWVDADPTNSLPDFPANTIVYQDGSDDRLYLGTDVGIFYTDKTMNCWALYGEGQVGVIVNDLEINYCTQTIYAATWGRGIWKAPLLMDGQRSYLTIDSDEIWDQNKTILGDILIKSGATLNISGTVNPNGTTTTNIFLPKDGKIIVEEGARLNVDGATLTNQCGEMWDGIDVHGTKDLWHPSVANIINDDYPSNDPLLHIYQQGVVVLNNATLSHARNAVSLGEFDGSTYLGGGGIVLAHLSNFTNNRRSFEFLSYPKFSNISTIENSIFEIDDNYRGEDLTEPHHISMWETKDVRVIGCDFDNINSSFTIDDVYAGTAIYTIDASYIARAICDPQNIEALTGDCILNPDRNKFTNLHRGIYSTATGVLPGSLQINKNEFNNVKKGITLRSTGDAITVRNILSSDEIEMLNEGINQPSYGIYLEGLYNFTCTENSVGNMWSGILTNSAGIGKNRLYRNIVDNTFYYGTTGFGFDLFGFSSGKNLEFKCNQFSNNGWIGDIAVTGKIKDQGTNDDPIINTFSDALAIDINAQSLTLFDGWIATNNTNGFNTPPFDYYYPDHSGNVDMDPEYTFGVDKEDVFVANALTYTVECTQDQLGNILMKTEENTSEEVSTQGYYSVLGDLNNSTNPDLWEKDKVLTQLINAHLIKGEYAAIETLLQGETSNHWRKLQMAEFQRMQAKYLDAKNNLNALINDNDVIAEVKDVASIYLIRTTLEQQGKTWFDLSSSDLNMIQNYALEEGELPATLIARNVLELVKGMYLDVRIDEYTNSINGPEDTTAIEEPYFTLYPNPIVGELNLEYSEEIPEYFKVVIYELLENTEVYSSTMESSLFQLNVSAWEPGFYSILVFDPENNELFKSSTHIKNQ